MKNYFLLLLSCALFSLSAAAQQPQAYKGWPSHPDGRDLRSSFAAPPAGYGNVPFFWFNGDTLNRERMKWELDILGQSATDGYAVSYIHLCPAIDSVQHKGGYGLFGHTEPGEPKIFSDEWWSFWNWFSGECARRGMGAGLDDYTVGWIDNGYYPDEAYRRGKYADYPGKLHFETHAVAAGASIELALPARMVGVAAWSNPATDDPIDLSANVEEGTLRWQAPAQSDYTLCVTYATPDYLLHPDVGRDLIEVYFDRFEQRMDAQGRAGMNYFFQDELLYPLTSTAWSADMREEFLRRKGYDVVPYLGALEFDLGRMTAKVRLDYCDVVMSLSEERYFKPIFDWHNERGLIYGCDNLGRGLAPLSYLDYFRATAWFTAPGNDAPARGSSFVQTKVSSSIAHAYGRPRTWLEAFHSMGWGSKAEWLTEQIDHHIIAGGNLVCMHGLYYSTHGGWWEWAPPCFHFRMPYWTHMRKWLEYTERLSYLTSQGDHVCDIALLYPTETLQVFEPDQTENYDFSYIMELSNHGLDYDFLDNRSLVGATVDDHARLQVGREAYKIILLKDIRALRFEALEKILEFYRAGGMVVAVGALPEATDRAGSNDPQVERIITEIFGIGAAQAPDVAAKVQGNAQGGKGFYLASTEGMVRMLRRSLIPDFSPGRGGRGKVLHRRVGEQDIYMVMNVKPGTECFFRAKGRAELWDASTGTTVPLAATRVSENGTYIRLDAPENRSSVVVFSPGEPLLEEKTAEVVSDSLTVLPIGGVWEVEVRPTMDNRWGDYRLPATEGMIGPEARSFRYAPANGLPKEWMSPAFDDSAWRSGVYGFGPKMELLADSSALPTEQLIGQALSGQRTDWKPYDFSWQYGVYNNPGSQGYHGLKGRVEENFLILDEGTRMLFRTRVLAPETGQYLIRTGRVEPVGLFVDRQPADRIVELKRGWHELMVAFDGTATIPLDMKPYFMLDPRPRSSVVLLPVVDSVVAEITPYADIVAMDWFRSAHLEYNPQGAPQRTAYRFEAAPGLESMELSIAGRLERVWVDGQLIDAKRQIRQPAPGCYEITLPARSERTPLVALQIVPEVGAQGTAVFREPVRLHCGTGLMEAGDWSQEGSLLHYSGGMLYRRSIALSAEQIARGVQLDLGEVSATCEIRINGREAGLHIYSPFRSEITSLLQPGVNHVEVLVFSTLANHYQTSPTLYRGEPEAGLLGPVRLMLGGQ